MQLLPEANPGLLPTPSDLEDSPQRCALSPGVPTNYGRMVAMALPPASASAATLVSARMLGAVAGTSPFASAGTNGLPVAAPANFFVNRLSPSAR